MDPVCLLSCMTARVWWSTQESGYWGLGAHSLLGTAIEPRAKVFRVRLNV